MQNFVVFNSIKNKKPIGAIKNNSTCLFCIKISNQIVNPKIDMIVYDELNNKEIIYNMQKSSLSKNIFENYEELNDFINCYGLKQDDFEIVNLENKKFKLILKEYNYIFFSTEVTFLEKGFYWYYFNIYSNYKNYKIGRDEYYDAKIFDFDYNLGENEKYLQFVYSQKESSDINFRDGICYQIFIDRFCKCGKNVKKKFCQFREDWGGDLIKNFPNLENDKETYYEEFNKEHFGGNFKGIISKLNYLKKLNVNCIYLSPIFEANSYHKYNTADYDKIDESFGTEEDLKSLIAKAKEKNIYIILDGVFNHTGSDSKYFNKLNHFDSIGAYQSQTSKYYDWYEFNSFPEDYSCWWNIKSLPQISKKNSKFIDYITKEKGVLDKWLNFGIYGIRLDVADELPFSSLEKINESIHRRKRNTVIIGEVWEDAVEKIAYNERKKYFLDNSLDSVTNYPLREGIIDFVCFQKLDKLKIIFTMILDHYPNYLQHRLLNSIDTHDTKRLWSIIKEDSIFAKNNLDNIFYSENNEKENLSYWKQYKNKEDFYFRIYQIATLIQFCFIGTPCIFYGDEIGLDGGDAPFCRVCYPWGYEDKRMLDWYKTLTKLKNFKEFKNGEMKILKAEDNILIFERFNVSKNSIITINMSTKDFIIKFDNIKKAFFENKIIENNFILKPFSFEIFENRN